MTELLRKQLDEVREMQRQGIVLAGAVDRARRIEELGTARWRTVPHYDNDIVVHLCDACGYRFGAMRTSACMAPVIDRLVAEHKEMHDEVCRSGRFTDG
jgi:hypothetical protein